MIFSFVCQNFMIYLVLFRLIVKLGTCLNEGGYYGRLSIFTTSISELMLLFYKTIFELLWFLIYIKAFVQIYLQDLHVQLNG